jgi:hypothetical protein
MKTEDMSLLLQLVSSMDLASQELEKAVEKKDAEKFKKVKEEILNFQRQITKLIG